MVWPLSLSLAATQKIDVSFSSSAYLDVSVQRVAYNILFYSYIVTYALIYVGFPIRKSADRNVFAVPRSLSQLVTSFFGSWCQGILPVLFLTWPIGLLLYFRKIIWVLKLLDYISLRNCFYPFYRKNLFYRISLFPSNTFLIVQFSMCNCYLQVTMVEMRRVELLTPCLQGRCSPNWATPPCLGGLKWARTTDLTLIRRVL